MSLRKMLWPITYHNEYAEYIHIQVISIVFTIFDFGQNPIFISRDEKLYNNIKNQNKRKQNKNNKTTKQKTK